MNVTLTSLEALILKATHESLPHPDAAALEAFCTIMRDSTDGPQFAAQALAARIQSQNAHESLLALSMLDRCMRRCEMSFHAEIGKFRFLNEMIKLVSPKYLANRTSPEVQTRVLQLLHAWTTQYPKETKFKVAFDMLRNQGVVKETPPPLPPEDTPFPARYRSKMAIFEDEEKSKILQRLLHSKKPEDLQHANRLIKTMVREVERRNEANSQRAQDVSAALYSAGLLRDMLERASEASPDEVQLIHELYASCTRLRPALEQLAGSDSEADSLEDILQAHDILIEVFENYNEFIAQKKSQTKGVNNTHSNNDTLLDFAGAISDNNVERTNASSSSKPNEVGDLVDIFSNQSGSNNISAPLKPISLLCNDDTDLLGDKRKQTEAWNELDSLGEQLMKQSLPDNAKRIDSFNSKQMKKIPMNALEISSPKHNTQSDSDPHFDLDFLIKKHVESPDKPEILPGANQAAPGDDVMVDISTSAPNTDADNKSAVTHPIVNTSNAHVPLFKKVTYADIKLSKTKKAESDVVPEQKDQKNDQHGDVKPLTDINMTLQSVHPSDVPPLTMFHEEGGVTVVLHFCKDRPRPDVFVFVISTTSKNKSPIEDYKFQAVVPKGCKVRLLSASSSSLPAYNPFLPPPALTQVMLLARPVTFKHVDLKFVITYNCDDETYSEMGETAKLPLEHL